MKIKWIKDCTIEIVENSDEDYIEDIKAGETDEIDIFDQRKDTHVDIQFGDGSIASGVPCDCFEKL